MFEQRGKQRESITDSKNTSAEIILRSKELRNLSRKEQLFERERVFGNDRQRQEAIPPSVFLHVPLTRTKLIIPFTVTGERVVSRTLRLI